MPAYYTHYTFVKLNTNPQDTYAKIRSLGGQGPDVFFFYGYLLGKREKKSQKRYFGTLLHHIDISDAYSFLLEYAAEQEDSEMLFSYLKGLFMHYVLDRNCHPYVFYRTGFADEDEDEPKVRQKYTDLHVGFEAIIDKMIGDRNSTFGHPKKCTKSPRNQVKSVSKMFYELAKYLKYDDINEQTYYKAYKDMIAVEKLFYSPLGVKKFLVHTFAKKATQVYNMISPRKTNKYDEFDILNMNHQVWYDCVKGTQHKESFLQLMGNAQRELAKVDELIRKAQNKEPIRKEMTSFINNIDHDGFKVDSTKLHYQIYCDLKDCK